MTNLMTLSIPFCYPVLRHFLSKFIQNGTVNHPIGLNLMVKSNVTILAKKKPATTSRFCIHSIIYTVKVEPFVVNSLEYVEHGN